MLNVIVLGSGCPNCRKLEQLCRDVAAENNLDMNLEKVTELTKITDYGILLTPGLVINGKVMSSGKIPTKSTLTHWIIAAEQGKL
jgi:small redox-active disulfide protein 2